MNTIIVRLAGQRVVREHSLAVPDFKVKICFIFHCQFRQSKTNELHNLSCSSFPAFFFCLLNFLVEELCL